MRLATVLQDLLEAVVEFLRKERVAEGGRLTASFCSPSLPDLEYQIPECQLTIADNPGSILPLIACPIDTPG